MSLSNLVALAKTVELRLEDTVSDKPVLDIPMTYLPDRRCYVKTKDWMSCGLYNDFSDLEEFDYVAGEYVLRTGEEE